MMVVGSIVVFSDLEYYTINNLNTFNKDLIIRILTNSKTFGVDMKDTS
jgi:hypothetical protein